MATITHDTLDWYGMGSTKMAVGVHDVISTRCDPYCCHSNLTRALVTERKLPLEEAEVHVHDVVNVFMCTALRVTGISTS